MAFEPKTNIYLCEGVPLDSRYTDTIIFQSRDTQLAYFKGMAGFNYPESTYQREEKFISVKENAEKLVNCNYCFYQNENFGNKWFYAFIDRVEYRNPDTSYIYFTIDVWQTYYFDLTFKPCYVEREHVNNDSIGANTIPENVQLGPYINTSERSYLNTGLHLIILMTEPIDSDVGSPVRAPQILGGFPVTCYWADLGELEAAMAQLDVLLNKASEGGKIDSIIALFTMPTEFATYGEKPFKKFYDAAPRNLNYVPRNNKLYTYPYCSLVIMGDSSASTLRYELFDNPSTPIVETNCSFGPNTAVKITPRNYEGQQLNFAYSQTITGWPICSWKSNIYENWIAQNTSSIVAGITSDILGGAASLAAGVAGALAAPATGGVSAVGAIAGTLSTANSVTSIFNTIAKIQDMSVVPDRMNGEIKAANVDVIMNRKGVRTFCRALTPEYLRTIDDFFSRTGYKVNRLKIPNITGRKSWNFVKTIGAEVVGRCPVTDLNVIKNTMDNGITFWHTTDVGNYYLDNGVI